MARTVSVLCALLLTLLGASVGAPLAHGDPPAGGSGDVLLTDGVAPAGASTYIVRFKQGSDRAAEVRNARAQGMGVQRELVHAFPGMVVQATAAQAGKLAARGSVEAVEKDAPVTVDAAQTGPNLPWGLDRIDQRTRPLDGRYAYPDGLATVMAYVIDSGLYPGHADFAGRIAYGAGVDGVWADCHGHGTHVAGTIGGTTHGVAKSVRFVPVRVVDCAGVGSVALTIAGIDWVIGDHAAGAPAVANLSLGGTASSLLDAAIARLTGDGVATVASAGNDAVDACGQSPARAPSALTVASSASDDTESWFSNHGSCVDLYAPGEAILSAGISGSTATAVKSGTSMAAPHVAGAAALVLGGQPGLNPAGVTAALNADATAGAIANPFPGTPNRLLFVQAPDVPAPIVPEPVLFSDTCGTADDTYTVPATTGVDYLLGDQVRPAGTYPATGTVTVTARAQAGRTLGGTSLWTYSFTNASAFIDVTPETAFFREMCWMANRGFSTGWQVPGGAEYRPLTPINRDAMAAFMYRLAGSPVWVPPSESPFLDVTPSTAFYTEITWLADQRISTGWPVAGGAEFRPLTPINRDAMAAFMYRLAGSPAWVPPSESPFLDVTPSTAFYTEITWLADQRISTGWPVAGRAEFRPLTPINRDAMAAFMHRFKEERHLA